MVNTGNSRSEVTYSPLVYFILFLFLFLFSFYFLAARRSVYNEKKVLGILELNINIFDFV